MEKFMANIAPSVWPKGTRIGEYKVELLAALLLWDIT
jgi:hypothetical protein